MECPGVPPVGAACTSGGQSQGAPGGPKGPMVTRCQDPDDPGLEGLHFRIILTGTFGYKPTQIVTVDTFVFFSFEEERSPQEVTSSMSLGRVSHSSLGYPLTRTEKCLVH